EAVEVDEEERGRTLGIVPELGRVAQPLVEERTVGKAGERVVEGELAELELGLPLAGDVEQVALKVERAALRVEHHDALVAQPDDASVARDQPVLDAERLVRLLCAHM